MSSLSSLARQLKGDLRTDSLHQSLYATDASIYRELPIGVVLPKDADDLKKLIVFAHKNKLPLIPRAAGTSLAGQCVGSGLVVDISQHFTKIIELNVDEKWVRVQAGVIRDELNRYLKPYGLFFGPNTSTANRCMLGGMVGNNSSGTTSIKYGVTRDHVLEIKAILSDGSEVEFKDLDEDDLENKMQQNSLEGSIYRHVVEEFNNHSIAEKIRSSFPKPEIHRRNTGYALDSLLEMQPFSPNGQAFNLSKLLCGSEGTLAFTTEVKLNLSELPPPNSLLICAHFNSVSQSLKAVLTSMKFEPYACELMDKVILDCTKNNASFEKYRFFLEGDPAAVLMVELRDIEISKVQEKATELIRQLSKLELGYAYPVLDSEQSDLAWHLRKAGLGLLSNIEGDARPVACVEDTAVALKDLPDYIADFEKLMESFGQQAVYYAHAGAGELHLRPILNLKSKRDRQLLYDISHASAKLVKKYRGSLSGEHGDGRVRAAFIPTMLGDEMVAVFRRLKYKWDPHGIFNPGKIVDAAPMNESLRAEQTEGKVAEDTLFDFSANGGILAAAEKCNGSGDCRKLSSAGGVMCPSYMATRQEKDSTRARANALREFLARDTPKNAFNHEELKQVMELCISCKGCTSECPSGVDMSTMKAEFQHQYYKSNRRPLRDYLFAYQARFYPPFSVSAYLGNLLFKSDLVKCILGIAVQRSVPTLKANTLRKWYTRHYSQFVPPEPKGKVLLFCDEFTNVYDSEIGKDAVSLLCKLGYEVMLPKHSESGRAALSKGMLKYARKCAASNVNLFYKLASKDVPVLGIEPSAILSFKDEYPRLLRGELQQKAKNLARHCMSVESFLLREVEAGKIGKKDFSKKEVTISFHAHCHQKAIGSASDSALAMVIPQNYSVQLIDSGCCGMAGSFGYEHEHYELSMQMGELSLFPNIRKLKNNTIIAATGTSCRHQIHDGTERNALHPIQVLWEAVLK